MISKYSKEHRMTYSFPIKERRLNWLGNDVFKGQTSILLTTVGQDVSLSFFLKFQDFVDYKNSLQRSHIKCGNPTCLTYFIQVNQ